MQIDTRQLEKYEEKGDWEWVVYWSALYYAEQGFYVVPLKPNTKFLPPKKYNVSYPQASKRKSVIEKWFHPTDGVFKGWNVGLATGKKDGMFAIDVDRHGKEDGFVGLDNILREEGLDELMAPCQKTPNGGMHFIFQWQENAVSSTSKIAPAIDTRGGTESACKGHIVVFPSMINDNQYRWDTGGEVPFIPKWALSKLGVVWKPNKYAARGNENISDEDLEVKVPIEQVRKMLYSINPDTLSYDDWLRLGQSINTQLPTDDGLQLWNEWSSAGERYKENECAVRWRGFDPTGPVRVGSLFYYAKENGWKPEENDVRVSKNAEIIERINSQFAIVVVGGKIKVLREKDHIPDPVLGHYDLMDKESFRTLLQNDRVEWTDPNGKTKYVSVADLWLANDARRTFPNGMRLMPHKKGHQEGYYNTWNGFAVEPREGDCGLLLSHIREVICDGNEDYYNWLIDWCADAVQDPAHPKGTCVVMRGEEGVGKGTLANTMGELFGSHYRHLIDDSHLLSNFNAHMMDALFIFADEITYGGNKKTAGKLKGMVTEEWLVGERKGVDAVGYRNMSHMMVASNSKWVIPAGTNSRRWFIVHVNNSHMGDRDYFASLNDQLDCGGREAFLCFLLNKDITSDLRKAPETEVLNEQRMKSVRFDTTLDWWITKITNGTLESNDFKDHEMPWPESVSTTDLYEEYEEFCLKRNRIPEHVTVFGKEMRKYGLKQYRPTINKIKRRGFKIPSLESSAEVIKKEYGIDLEFIDDEV